MPILKASYDDATGQVAALDEFAQKSALQQRWFLGDCDPAPCTVSELAVSM